MHSPIGDQRIAGVDRVAPGPVRKGPARLPGNRRNRRDVPRIDLRLNDDINSPCRQQHMGVTVAPPARATGGSGQCEIEVAATVGGEVINRGRAEQRVAGLGGLRDAGRSLPEALLMPRPAAPGCPDGFIKSGNANDAGDGASLVLNADQRPVEGDAVDEGLRSVDGVENPAIAAAALPDSVFLAENGVGGKGGFDALTQEDFGLAVGAGDDGAVALAIDLEIIALKILEREAAGLDGDVAGKSKAGVEVVLLAHGSSRAAGLEGYGRALSLAMNEQDAQCVRIGVLTVSDRASRGEYEDLSGPAILKWLGETVASAWEPVVRITPDEQEQIEAALIALCDLEGCHLVITTGGTGPALRDVTPEATEAVCSRMMPGFGEAMRAASLRLVATAILSRQTAGIRGKTLILNLPGKPKAVAECLDAIFAAVPYCVELLGGPKMTTDPSRLATFRPV